MLEMRTDTSERALDRFLLDVGVKGVKQHSDFGMIHSVAQRPGVLHGVQKERFKTIQRLDCQRHAAVVKSRNQRI